MKINGDLVRSQSKESVIQTLQYVDLSKLDIYVLEKLSLIKRVQILDISHNHIESITSNVEQCPQLWSLNISDNKVRCLDGFGRFVAVGTLDLSGNQLSWSELAKIKHLHILDLRLHGNTQLERDPYYRVHVIDCLPHVWMLDGRLITSAERIQVKSFFDESAVSERPVRHKLTQKCFLPSNQRNRDVSGVFGEKVVHLMTRFPKQDIANIDLDRRRLKYLSENIAHDISIQSKIRYSRQHRVREMSEIFLVELLEARKSDAQRCNMFIILLLTSMEFAIPDSLIKETLELMKLDKFGNVGAMEVFALPQSKRALVAGVLLSAVKIERVEKQTGGLYDKLYLSMNYLLTECIKSASGYRSNVTGIYKQYRSLLAAEVVLLMCYVPSFAEYLQKEPGVMSLVTSATCDTQVITNVSTLKDTLTMQEVGEEEQIKSIGQFVQSAVMIYLAKSSGKASPSKTQLQEEKLLTKKPLPKRPMSGPVFSSSYHTKGQTSPDRRPPRITSAKPKPTRQPDVGEIVLTAPQCLARIVSLPQPGIALVLLEMIPVNGAMSSKSKSFEEHYAYIDTQELIWDAGKSYWKPRGTIGNRVTLHYVQDIDTEVGQIEYCHHSVGAGRATPITVPQPYGDTADTASVVSTKTAQEMLAVSPRKHHGAHSRSSSPSMGRGHSSPKSARRTPGPSADLIKETEGLDGLTLAEPDENMNNSATTMSVNVTNNRQHSPDMQRPAQQLSIIQFGAMPSPKKKPEPAEEDRPEHKEGDSAVNHEIELQHASNPEDISPQPAPAAPQVPEGEGGNDNISSPVNSAAEYEEDNTAMSSDDEELDKLAREDLIRDMLTNNDLERSISERNVAPNNSPDMRASYSISRASNQTASQSRQPSARINSVYRMLKAQDEREGYRSAPTGYRSYRQGTPDYGNETYSPYMQERAQEWDMKIHDPDETPNVSVKWANLWMGAGRDLHHEEMRKRPTSAHVPGWKDGLKGARTRSANTMSNSCLDITRELRYANMGQSRRNTPANSTRASQSTYDRQLDHQQYKFYPQQTSYRSSYLTSNRNMRSKNQLVEMQRDIAWSEYVNSATLHRQMSGGHPPH